MSASASHNQNQNQNYNNSNQALATSNPFFLLAVFCMGAAGAAGVSVYFKEPRPARSGYSGYSRGEGYQSVFADQVDLSEVDDDQERVVGTTSFS